MKKVNQENEVIVSDNSTMTKIGRQIAQESNYSNYRSGAKNAAKAAANRAYSMMLKGIDEYFNMKREKIIK